MAKKSPNPTDRHVGTRIRMRRLMLSMSQTSLAEGLSLTFQQIQKYEKGTNRVGASRLQQIAHILQVPVAFFFEGAPPVPGQKAPTKDAPSMAYVSEFLATSDGLALVAGFTKITSSGLRRSIVELVDHLAQDQKK
jgi:transcriptional regulator with XRE-family HTH domain